MARTRYASEPWAPLDRRVERDFKGMASNADPHDLPPGYAALQVNCLPRRPGELGTRLGLAPLTFDD